MNAPESDFFFLPCFYSDPTAFHVTEGSIQKQSCGKWTLDTLINTTLSSIFAVCSEHSNANYPPTKYLLVWCRKADCHRRSCWLRRLPVDASCLRAASAILQRHSQIDIEYLLLSWHWYEKQVLRFPERMLVLWKSQIEKHNLIYCQPLRELRIDQFGSKL